MTTSKAKNNGSDRWHVFAIVRLDEFPGLDVPLTSKVTVKEIVWTEEEAKAEVERLNNLQAGKHCSYIFQLTRLFFPKVPQDVADSGLLPNENGVDSEKELLSKR